MKISMFARLSLPVLLLALPSACEHESSFQYEIDSSDDSPGGGGWLGVVLDTDGEGRVLVTEVVAGSPAERAGLRSGDRMLVFEGEQLRGTEALSSAIARCHGGQRVDFEILRDGHRVRFEEIEIGQQTSGRVVIGHVPEEESWQGATKRHEGGLEGDWQRLIDEQEQALGELLSGLGSQLEQAAERIEAHVQGTAERIEHFHDEHLAQLSERAGERLEEARDRLDEELGRRREKVDRLREDLQQLREHRLEELEQLRDVVGRPKAAPESAPHEAPEPVRNDEAPSLDELRRQVEELRAELDQLRQQRAQR